MSTRADEATVASLGERELIRRIRARVPPSPPWLPVGIGDDAAVVVPARGAFDVIATDACVEGIHFDTRFSSFHDIGWKALAVNLSDLASMGAAPRLALLSLMLPDGLRLEDFDALLDGFFDLAGRVGVTLAGGNITRSPGPLAVDVTVTGSVRPRRVLTRGAAEPGQDIYVTGTVGAAAAGLGWLRERSGSGRTPESDGMAECVARYCRPEPRVRAGMLAGRNRAASAGMDLSDGLADAVRQIADASGVGAVLDAAALPIPEAAARWFAAQGQDAVHAALAGGDDYELLLAVPRRARGRFATVVRQSRGLPFTRIGQFTAARDLLVRRDGAAEPLPAGFVHFTR